MGVPILSETASEKLAARQYRQVDLSGVLYHNNELAAIDKVSSTIYISQHINETTKAKDLVGTIRTKDLPYELCFLADKRFDDIYHAVADGYPFKLIILLNEKEYTKYNVIFTSLPVIKMEGTFKEVDDEERDVFAGSLCIWSPFDINEGRYSVKKSLANWHVRGGLTKNQDKKSWRISLKSNSGSSKDLSLLGLGSDDDWILNSMTMDDTKVREKLAADIWNLFQSNSKLRMSAGEYYEVIHNGQYQGLYLLQRRIDAKYLGLSADYTLFKGRSTWTPANVEEAYEIIAAPLAKDSSYQLMEDYFQGDLSIVDVDNWIDVYLMLQLGNMVDNVGYKNMYYLVDSSHERERLYFIPWDTDMSFGLWWDGKFTYKSENADNGIDAIRKEYALLSLCYPDLNAKINARWLDLRKSVFRRDVLSSLIDNLDAQITSSGALTREHALWGIRYDGCDTIENMKDYIERRLIYLDNLLNNR